MYQRKIEHYTKEFEALLYANEEHVSDALMGDHKFKL